MAVARPAAAIFTKNLPIFLPKYFRLYQHFNPFYQKIESLSILYDSGYYQGMERMCAFIYSFGNWALGKKEERAYFCWTT